MFKGNTYNIKQTTMGRVEMKKTDESGISYFVSLSEETNDFIYLKCGLPNKTIFENRSWHSNKLIDLNMGDIVRITTDGYLSVIYDSSSKENVFLLTENCNSICLMCPQPPVTHKSKYYQEAKEILLMVKESPEVIGFTGGEPLLHFNEFIDLVSTLRSVHPNTHIQLLTNGTLLEDCDKTSKLISSIGERVTFCIPLYSSIPSVHDSITKSAGSFWKTMKGIFNLSQFNADIEIRNVVIQQNYHELPHWAHFIAMNVPFVNHVAIMGMEPMGYAKENYDFVWIDPFDYQDQLKNAIQILKRNGVNFSIFNHQICITPKEIRPYLAKSISSWKVKYKNECYNCEVKKDCGGFFFSSIDYERKGICRQIIPRRAE